MTADRNEIGATSSARGGIDDLPTILLFLSREELTDEQSAVLSRVLTSENDADLVMLECTQRLIAPISLSHLITFGADRFNTRLEEWKAERRDLAAQSMLFFAEMMRFHELCIECTCADHIFLKGPSLARQYYANPSLRRCRDIDVLIPEAQIGKVIQAALSEGYLIANVAYGRVAHRGLEAVEAFIAMTDVLTVRSPNGVFFEIHKTIDRNAGFFDPDRLFAAAEPLDFFGRSVKVLPPELLLCYVVYHSTQHTWARLNWFTDVHAILSHEGFERGRCMEMAERLGLGRLVAACIELDDWCSAGAQATSDLREGALALYEMFVDNIQGGLMREKEIILHEHGFGLPKRFQAAGHARRRALLNHVSQAFSPDFELYSRYPMKPGLWWVYMLMRPPISVIGLIKSRMMGARRQN